MSALGQKQTSLVALHMSAFRGKAEMHRRYCRSFRAVADGVPGNGKEACANVHAHGVGAVE